MELMFTAIRRKFSSVLLSVEFFYLCISMFYVYMFVPDMHALEEMDEKLKRFNFNCPSLFNSGDKLFRHRICAEVA